MKRVPLSYQRVIDYTKNFKSEADVEFPELRELFGYSDDEMPVLKIKAASLDDHLRAQSLHERVAILAIKMLEGVRKKDFKDVMNYDEMKKELTAPVGEKAMLEVSIFHRCVLRPKFSLREAYLISQAFPEVINRVVVKALALSSLESLQDDNSKSSQSTYIGG